MFGLIISKNLIQTTTSSSSSLLYFIRQLSSFSNFTVEYLINSCGLSQSAAISASHKVHFDTPNKPDSVLSLFSAYGFTNSQISTVIAKLPKIMVSDPEKTLKPKIEFFVSVGISEVGHLLSRDPQLLNRSLKHQIIPAFDFLNQFLHSHNDVICCFKRFTWMINAPARNVMEENIGFLRQNGVPESRIIMLLKRPRSLWQPHNRFKEIVIRVTKMGFDPLTHGFVDAVFRMTGLQSSNWESKFEVYRRWGWSNDDILSAFKRDPAIIVISEKKINQVMGFIVNDLGWDSSYVLKRPMIFRLSLENRIIPRLLVVQLLISKGLITKKFSSVLGYGEKQFLEKFVSRHKDHASELLNLYRKKLGCGDFP